MEGGLNLEIGKHAKKHKDLNFSVSKPPNSLKKKGEMYNKQGNWPKEREENLQKHGFEGQG